jgi:hypothetical protein
MNRALFFNPCRAPFQGAVLWMAAKMAALQPPDDHRRDQTLA